MLDDTRSRTDRTVRRVDVQSRTYYIHNIDRYLCDVSVRSVMQLITAYSREVNHMVVLHGGCLVCVLLLCTLKALHTRAIVIILQHVWRV